MCLHGAIEKTKPFAEKGNLMADTTTKKKRCFACGREFREDPWYIRFSQSEEPSPTDIVRMVCPTCEVEILRKTMRRRKNEI